MLRKIAFTTCAAALLAPSAFAHHPTAVSGSGGAGPIYTISASTLEQGQSAGSVVFEQTQLRSLSEDSLLANANLTGGHAHSIRTIEAVVASFAYGLTKDLTVSARLPWIRRSGITEAEFEDPGPAEFNVRGDASGVGDLTLLGQYRFYNNPATRTEAAVLLGIKLPTGVTERFNAQGERFDAEFQPGSGSWDGLFGLAFTHRFGSWSFDTNVLYFLTGTGVLDTNLGDRVLYNAALSYRLTGDALGSLGRMNLGGWTEPMYHGGPKAHSHAHEEPPAPTGPALDLVLEINGEWHAREVAAGITDPNSGGNTVYLSPGLRLSKGNMSSFVSVGVPIVKDLNGLQSEPSFRLLTGVAVSF